MNPTRLKIENLRLALREPDMLAECVTKVSRYEDADVSIWPQNRQDNEWLEWHIDVHFNSGSKLFIGAIQRKKNDKYEFHT